MKLIKKTEGWYNLYDGEIGIGSTHKELQGFKLSLKNCQAIEIASPTEEYILEVNGEGWDDHLYRGSRKQTEWAVEIEMEEITLPFGANQFYKDYKSKLEDGYIILKRI